jgi:hypothetical protein
VGELETAQQKHLGRVAQAQFVAQPAEYDFEHNIGRKFKEVERSTGSFIRLAATTTATKTPPKR